VDHLRPGGAAAHLAEATQPDAGPELGDLRPREIEEAERQLTGAVRNAHEQ